MSELESKVQVDDALSGAIDSIARRMLASLFYFELESMLEKINGNFVAVGHVQCFREQKTATRYHGANLSPLSDGFPKSTFYACVDTRLQEEETLNVTSLL